MLGDALAIAFFVLAAIAALLALRLTGRLRWLFAWLRGTAVIALLVLAVALVFTGIDVLSYREVKGAVPVATISFRQTGPRQFDTVLARPDGSEQHFTLTGDQWQLDARLLRFSQSIPAAPLIRLERLSGRYLSIEDERDQPRSVYALSPGSRWVDIWQIARDYPYLFGFLKAQYGSATFMPMVDGALYSISLGQSGLIGQPLNERAQQAVADWQ